MLESLKARALIRHLVVLLAIQLFTVTAAFAQSLLSAPQIFDVRISLPLEPEDEAYHDFYINAGPDSGLKKGMYVTVVRLVPVHDPVQNKQQATLTVDVARLQVIHVERGITVARLDSEFTDEERPTLEYESVMIGDRIDPSSFTMDAPKKKQKIKKKVAVEAPPRPVEPAHEAVSETSAAVAAAVKAVVATAPAPVAAPVTPAAAAPVPAPAAVAPTAAAPAPQAPGESASAAKPSVPASIPVPAPATGSKGASNTDAPTGAAEPQKSTSPSST